MNDFTSFVDVAGRVSRSTDIHHRVTAAAMTLSTSEVQTVRSRLAVGLGKWKDTTFAEASAIVDFMNAHAVAVGIFAVNKRTPAWDKYWQDSLDVEKLIRRQDGASAGFVRAPNFLRFHLMGGAASVSFGHAFHRTKNTTRIVDYLGHAIIEQRIVFDNDIQGAENEEMLQIMLSQPMPKSEAGFGIKVKRHMSLKTEQEEPLLLLADFAAGIAHAALLPDADGKLPLSVKQANLLLKRLHDAGLLAFHQQDFDVDCRQVFGDLMDRVSEKHRADTRSKDA